MEIGGGVIAGDGGARLVYLFLYGSLPPPGLPRRRDVLWGLGVAVLWPALRLMLERALHVPGVRALFGRKGFTKKEGRPRKLSEKDARKLAKWKESVWKLLVYGGLCLYGFYVVHDEPFFWDSEEFWSGNACPSTCQSWPSCSRVHFDSEIKLYYALTFGHYLSGVFMLLFWEVRRKDHTVMMAHHLVTLALIVISYEVHLLRVGTMIMLLHDFSDIFLESAKIFKYSGNEQGSTVMFVCFLFAWVATRLVYFPAHIIRSALFSALWHCPEPLRLGLMGYFFMFNGLLLALLGLHIYWTYFIAKIVYDLLVKGDLDDKREESD